MTSVQKQHLATSKLATLNPLAMTYEKNKLIFLFQSLENTKTISDLDNLLINDPKFTSELFNCLNKGKERKGKGITLNTLLFF